MNADQTIIQDPNSLSSEELIEEYERLSRFYISAKETCEVNAQQIYELKRSLKTATNAEEYLSNELDHITATHTRELEKVHTKYAKECEETRNKLSDLKTSNTSLENELEEVKSENQKLRQKVVVVEEVDPPNMEVSLTLDKELRRMESENADLVLLVNEMRINALAGEKQLEQLQLKVEELKERLECTSENLASKKLEIEEKTQMLESNHEAMCELNAELALFKCDPGNENRKGNSLFAEVDDQRQQMRELLNAQKKNYLHMKKVYNESEAEIRRLKRENAAMHKELSICSALFMKADQDLIAKCNERSMQLLKHNKLLEEKLSSTEMALSDLSRGKGIEKWLDSMLDYCSNETKELKEQLYSSRIERSMLDNTNRTTLQEMAKWRFECLKLRGLLIKREDLLELNKIAFIPGNEEVINVAEDDMVSATPDIRIGVVKPELKDASIDPMTPVKYSDNLIDNQEKCKKSCKQDKGIDTEKTKVIPVTHKLHSIKQDSPSKENNQIIILSDSDDEISLTDSMTSTLAAKIGAKANDSMTLKSTNKVIGIKANDSIALKAASKIGYKAHDSITKMLPNVIPDESSYQIYDESCIMPPPLYTCQTDQESFQIYEDSIFVAASDDLKQSSNLKPIEIFDHSISVTCPEPKSFNIYEDSCIVGAVAPDVNVIRSDDNKIQIYEDSILPETRDFDVYEDSRIITPKKLQLSETFSQDKENRLNATALIQLQTKAQDVSDGGFGIYEDSVLNSYFVPDKRGRNSPVKSESVFKAALKKEENLGTNHAKDEMNKEASIEIQKNVEAFNAPITQESNKTSPNNEEGFFIYEDSIILEPKKCPSNETFSQDKENRVSNSNKNDPTNFAVPTAINDSLCCKNNDTTVSSSNVTFLTQYREWSFNPKQQTPSKKVCTTPGKKLILTDDVPSRSDQITTPIVTKPIQQTPANGFQRRMNEGSSSFKTEATPISTKPKRPVITVKKLIVKSKSKN